MNRKSLRGSLLLLIGSAIWGSAFVAQDVAMDFVGPYTFNALRYFVGALTLLPIIFINDLITKAHHADRTKAEQKAINSYSWKAGIITGLALIIPTTLQQIGLTEASAGKAGMITGMYIISVPLLGLFLGKKCGLNVWIAVLVGVVGLYLLCVNGEFSLAKTDILLLISILFWGIQILAVDHFADKTDCFRMVCMQFIVCGTLSAVPMFIFEKLPDMDALSGIFLPLLYVGIFSCGLAYTLQPLGQRDTPPAAASLIMCLESVFAAVTGYVLLHDAFTPRELLGCALMLGATVLAQFPFGSKNTADKAENAVSTE